MSRLSEEGCVPCREGGAPLAESDQQQLRTDVPAWSIDRIDGMPRLVRVFKFDNFTRAMRFAVVVGRIADEQDHHPELIVSWGRVQVSWWTHAIGGLHRNDFVMAAKTDAIYAEEAGAGE
jgi:4a-hydroxytetrahydrobiopterin dehydratase